MTTLNDIFLDLSTGEFAQLTLGDHNIGDPDSEPDPRTWMQLIRHINLGLTALHTEFHLRSEEVYIQLYEAISTYQLDYRFAVSNVASVEATKYIVDTVDNPWADNVLKIEEVYDEEGNLLFLNDPDEDDSLYTPTWKSIQVPWPNDWNSIAVQYRANHPQIIYSSGMDPTTEYLDLPHPLREALLFYVAARIFASISTEKPEANDYYRKYLAILDNVNRHGLYITTDQDNSRFTEGGWC